ncbi:MAG: DsbA family protein [bacterium]
MRGEDVRSAEVLAAVAARHGLDVAAIEAPAVKQALFDTTAEAFERGVFGVPTFAVGGRLHWGQDRMHFVEALLGGPTTAAPPAPAEAPGPARVRFFHDYASPYSYLAAQRIEAGGGGGGRPPGVGAHPPRRPVSGHRHAGRPHAGPLGGAPGLGRAGSGGLGRVVEGAVFIPESLPASLGPAPA